MDKPMLSPTKDALTATKTLRGSGSYTAGLPGTSETPGTRDRRGGISGVWTYSHEGDKVDQTVDVKDVYHIKINTSGSTINFKGTSPLTSPDQSESAVEVVLNGSGNKVDIDLSADKNQHQLYVDRGGNTGTIKFGSRDDLFEITKLGGDTNLSLDGGPGKDVLRFPDAQENWEITQDPKNNKKTIFTHKTTKDVYTAENIEEFEFK
jgi:hypothetical protein